MTEQELDKLHKISIDMAREFSDFCDEHGLTCYLCGGGCIGAVRHGGMIPWDDDLDFFMPRKDYEKAWRLWVREKKDSRYILEKATRTKVTHDLFFKLRDKETTYVYEYQRDVRTVHGVALDVLPLDGYPAKKLDRMKQVFFAYIYSLYCSQLIPAKHGKLVGFISRIMLWAVPGRRARYRIWRYAEKKMTSYPIEACKGITELCSGVGYMKNYYPKEAFEKAVKVPFDDTVLPIPSGYDIYLSIAFGDYMKLPPQDKRVPHHEACFMDLDSSYKKYVSCRGGRVSKR